LAENRIVAAAVIGFATRSRAGPPAEMHCQLYSVDAFDQLIVHVGCEVGGAIGVFVLTANPWVDEQAQMRIVDLDDRNALFAQ
jgi:hypothetical protein